MVRSARPVIGVLALQGDFEAHQRALERAGARAVAVRTPADLAGVEGIVLPGGESTAIAKGLARTGLLDALAERARAGTPFLGTCAGAILMAKRVANRPVPTLGLLDVTAVRNAYGTQVDSFVAPADDDAAAGLEGLSCVFIRAPRLEEPGPDVEVLARVDGSPVLLREGTLVAATFHPELTGDDRVHGLLLDLVRRASPRAAEPPAAASRPAAGRRSPG
jgi:5'-phosphate synthase pdxT subunit